MYKRQTPRTTCSLQIVVKTHTYAITEAVNPRQKVEARDVYWPPSLIVRWGKNERSSSFSWTNNMRRVECFGYRANWACPSPLCRHSVLPCCFSKLIVRQLVFLLLSFSAPLPPPQLVTVKTPLNNVRGIPAESSTGENSHLPQCAYTLSLVALYSARINLSHHVNTISRLHRFTHRQTSE